MTPGPNYEINYRAVVALSTVAICCYLEKDYHGLVSLRKQNEAYPPQNIFKLHAETPMCLHYSKDIPQIKECPG